MHKMLTGLGCTALLIAPIGRGTAADGWSTFGESIGGLGDSSAYYEGQRLGMERLRMRLETEAALAEVETRNRTEQIKSRLSEWWLAAGYSASEARAFASAFEPAASGAAVIAGVRRKGSRIAVADIYKALNENNYLLANQLLLAVVIVDAEETKVREEDQRREAEARMETERAESARAYKERMETETRTLARQQSGEHSPDEQVARQ